MPLKVRELGPLHHHLTPGQAALQGLAPTAGDHGAKGDHHYDWAMIKAGPITPRPVMTPDTAFCSSAR